MDGERRILGDNKDKYPWFYSTPRSAYGGDLHYYSTGFLGGFSWPPRSYTCSFCRREFRSAQALGGHMNVHRRERALLRQSPPWEAHSSSQNPNPSSLPALVNNNIASTCTTSNLLASSLTCASTSPSMANASALTRDHDVNLTKSLFVDGKMMGSDEKEEAGDQKDGLVTLDFEIGMLKHDVVDHTGQIYFDDQDLDLELRLGYN